MNREDRLDQVIADYLDSVEAGQAPSRDGLLEAHPDLADSLRRFLDDYHHLRAAVRSDEPAGADLGTRADQRAASPDRTAPANDATKHAERQVASDAPTVVLGSNDSQEVAPGYHGHDLGQGERKSAAQPGDIGPYEILDKIAQGGMGIVYRARHRQLNRVVALKMILAGESADPDEVLRFRAEAEAIAKLDHPGIVPIYDLGRHQGNDYFAMAFVDGRSLAELLKQGPMASMRAADYLERIARAVHYANEQGVVHRDLKPANILIDQQDQPRVTDFGLAKLTRVDSELTRTGQILGTPAYMPPEQAEGRLSEIDARSDVYGLGATLFAMLTGRPPFLAVNPLDTLLQVIEDEPLDPRSLNPQANRDLVTICLRCLNKQPHARYSSAAALADDLRRLLNGEPILARPTTRWERIARWCRRKPWTAASVNLALVLAVALTAIMWQGEHLRLGGIDRNERNANTAKSIASQRQRNVAVAANSLRPLATAWRDHCALQSAEDSPSSKTATLELVAYRAAARAMAEQFLARMPSSSASATTTISDHYEAALAVIDQVLAGTPQSVATPQFSNPTLLSTASNARTISAWQWGRIDCLEYLGDLCLAANAPGSAARRYAQAIHAIESAGVGQSELDAAQAQLARLKIGLTAGSPVTDADALKQVGEFAKLAQSGESSAAKHIPGLIRLPGTNDAWLSSTELSSIDQKQPKPTTLTLAAGEQQATSLGSDDIATKLVQGIEFLRAGNMNTSLARLESAAALLLEESESYAEQRPLDEASAKQLVNLLLDAAAILSKHSHYELSLRFAAHALAVQGRLADQWLTANAIPGTATPNTTLPAVGRSAQLQRLREISLVLYAYARQLDSPSGRLFRTWKTIKWPSHPTAIFVISQSWLVAAGQQGG